MANVLESLILSSKQSRGDVLVSSAEGKKSHLVGVLEGLELICTHSRPRGLLTLLLFIVSIRLLLRRTLLFAGRHVASRSRRAVRCDALCYVSLRAGKTSNTLCVSEPRNLVNVFCFYLNMQNRFKLFKNYINIL